MPKIIQFFINSCGVLLLLLAAVFFLGNEASAKLVSPRDPLIMVSIRTTYWIICTLTLVVALVCLFGKRKSLQAAMLLWLAIDFLVYQAGLYWSGVTGGFKGYFGGVSAAFWISASTADWLLKVLVLYLLTGSLLALLWLWRHKELIETSNNFFKTSCSVCGGHIMFAVQNIGQTITCPHCQKATLLRKTDLLKMSCFFCQGHIEFPAHAIGEKMPCPHCKMDITLKEPA